MSYFWFLLHFYWQVFYNNHLGMLLNEPLFNKISLFKGSRDARLLLLPGRKSSKDFPPNIFALLTLKLVGREGKRQRTVRYWTFHLSLKRQFLEFFDHDF